MPNSSPEPRLSPSLAAANAARAYYATPRGRRERLASVEAEMQQIGAEIDELRKGGAPIPHALRRALRDAGRRRASLIDRAGREGDRKRAI